MESHKESPYPQESYSDTPQGGLPIESINTVSACFQPVSVDIVGPALSSD